MDEEAGGQIAHTTFGTRHTSPLHLNLYETIPIDSLAGAHARRHGTEPTGNNTQHVDFSRDGQVSTATGACADWAIEGPFDKK